MDKSEPVMPQRLASVETVKYMVTHRFRANCWYVPESVVTRTYALVHRRIGQWRVSVALWNRRLQTT